MKSKIMMVAVLAAMLAAGMAGCTIRAGLKKRAMELSTRGGPPERTPIYHHGDWIIARASLHNHTVYSDGCRSAEDLLELARQQGMAVLAYNDHREGKICAGARGKFCVSTGGLETVGYYPYFTHLRKIQRAAADQDMIVIKGIEVIPYLFNYGKGTRVVIDGPQQHFTVYGIEDIRIFENMPTRDLVPLEPEPIPDEKPWADFVDYIDSNGGIVHAVHVEDGADMWYGPAHGACPPPVDNVHKLKNLTGFSILPSGWRQAGAPGGFWDTVLVEYLLGMRQRPVWASADADYHCQGSLASATTLLYMREFTEPEVYRCMREGRMVALQGDAFQDSYVTKWWVSDTGQPENPVMLGEEVVLRGAPTIRFSLNRNVSDCRVRLIRNGVVILEPWGTGIIYLDEDLGRRKEPAYYRVEVIGPVAEREPYQGQTMPHSELLVNPIFVRFEK